MDVSRRTILGGLLVPLTSLPRFAFGQDSTAGTLFVVLDQISATLSTELAAKVLEMFFTRGIPIAATLSCHDQTPTSDSFIQLFKDVAARERGLFELVLEDGVAARDERYFQLRAAIDLRDCLLAGTGQAAPIVSILDRSEDRQPDPYALRAAGFRVLLQPVAEEGGFQVIDWGISRLSGFASVNFDADPATALPPLKSQEAAHTLFLSLANAGSLAPDVVLAHAEAWADRLQKAMLEEDIFLTRPMDHLLQGNPGASKYVGLVLDFSGDPDPESPIAEFAKRLDQADLPYTRLTDEAGSGAETCAFAPPETARCQAVETAGAAEQNSLAEIIAIKNADPYFWTGPRADGRFYAGLQPYKGEDFAEMMVEDPLSDNIFLIDSANLGAPVQQEALIDQFLQAKWDGKTTFYTLDSYMEQTLAPDPVVERFWSSRRRQASDPAAPLEPSEAAHAEFMEDAALAWSFIARFTDEKTGICAGTVHADGSEIINQWVALWDVASQMQGILAAREIGLIRVADAQARVALLLENLPTVTLDDHPLPPALFRADNPAVSRKEFNACDTGRFLIALKALVRSGLVTQARAESVFSQWDIASAVRDEQPHDYNASGWANAGNSHCTQYSRNGYMAWGMPVKPAYSALSDPQSGDQHIRLLYTAANIGHFGTEPLLLEGLELSYSPETRYLANVLFDAQLSWFEQTGHYKCASETPLNFAPWFSYQGLRADRSGADSWIISTILNAAAYKTPKFYRRAEMISSKSAFLWAVEYPHSYSSQLLALIREKARLSGLGFSIGLNGSTLDPVQGYSDVNTNGIILTAIAKALREV